MKRIFLSLALVSASLVSAYACSGNSATAQSQQSSAAAAKDDKKASAEASPVKHIDAKYMREHIWDYKETPNKFVYKGTRPAIIDFYATWCGPCRSLSPKLEAAAKKYVGKIDVYKIDVDKEPQLAQVFGVQSIPMVLFIKPGEVPIQTVGDLTPDQIQETIDQIYSAQQK